MAEVEVAEAVVPETTPTESTSEAVPYDESLLIKDSKGRVKRPAKPDDAERNKQVEKLQEQITKYSDRIKDIKIIIEERRGSAKSVSGGTKDIMRRLQDLRNQFQSVLRQKGHIRDELQEVNRSRDDIRAQLKAIREKTTQRTVGDVDTKLQELEDRLRYDSMSAQDEKKVHDQLSKLRLAKPLIKEQDVLTQKLSELDVQRQQIIDRLKECDDVLNQVKANETQERAELDSIKSAESDQTSDVPSLHNEKTECYQIIVSLRDKITEIRKDFNEKWQEWVKLDKAFNAYTRHIKKKQYEERKQQREERDKERQEKTKAVVVIPPENMYESEILSCDQMLTYLKRFLAQEEAVQETVAADISAPAPGMKLLKKKNDDAELDGFFAGKGKKGKGAKKAAQKEETGKKPDPKKKLVHDIDTLKTFMMLKVDVPQSMAEVEKAHEAVAAAKARYLELREKHKDGTLPMPAPASNGTKAEEAKEEETKEAAEDAEEETEEANHEEDDKVEANGVNGVEKEAAVANGNGDVSVTLRTTEDGEVALAVTVSDDAEAPTATA